MAMKTKIRETLHYVSRVGERITGHDLEYANRTFDHIMKHVKKGRIIPRNGNRPGTLTVYFKGLVFVYSENQDGSKTIITTYDTREKKNIGEA